MTTGSMLRFYVHFVIDNDATKPSTHFESCYFINCASRLSFNINTVFFVLLFAQSDEQLTREAIAITARKLKIVDGRCWSQKPRVQMNKFRSSIPDGAIFRAKVL